MQSQDKRIESRIFLILKHIHKPTEGENRMASVVETQSARNAIRHGLSGDKFVPAHAADHFNQIKAGLARIYEPGTPQMEALVEELAFCRWKIFEADRIFELARQAELPLAADYFRRHQLARFQADLAAFEQSPGTMLDHLLLSLPGTRYLLSVWEEARDTMESQNLLSLAMVKNLIAALGSPFDINRMSHKTFLFALCCIRASTMPTAMLDTMMTEPDPQEQLSANRRVLNCSELSKSIEESRLEVLALAKARITELKARVELLERHEQAMIEAFGEMHAGFGLLDPALTRQASRINRYRMQATHRAAFLEFRLMRLLDENQKNANAYGSSPVMARPNNSLQNDFLKFVKQHEIKPFSGEPAEIDHLTDTGKPVNANMQVVQEIEDTGELRNDSFKPADALAGDATETVPMSQALPKWKELAGWEDSDDLPFGRAV